MSTGAAVPPRPKAQARRVSHVFRSPDAPRGARSGPYRIVIRTRFCHTVCHAPRCADIRFGEPARHFEPDSPGPRAAPSMALGLPYSGDGGRGENPRSR